MAPRTLVRALVLALLAFPTSPPASAATHRFYRFTTESLRQGGRRTPVQLSELTFYSPSGPIAETPLVSNPGGSNPDGEGPGNLVDSNPATKWLDFNRNPVVFDFGAPVTIDHYGFTTANDVPERDPDRWTFEGSDNGFDWVLLDDRSQSTVEYPTTRFASYEFTLNQAPQLPTLEFTATAGPVESAKAVAIDSGETATLEWQVSGADSVSLDDGTGGVATASSGALAVSPATTRDYTLTATNAAGAAVHTLTVHVDPSVLPPRLNEFMARPDDEDLAHLDEDREPSDWIELRNPNEFAIPLAGYQLTDAADLSTAWTFPDEAHLDAGAFLVVFASGKDRATAGQELHTDFSLAKEGEYLALLGPDGSPVDAFSPAYPEQYDDVSYGLLPAGGLDHFTDPTPGQENDTPPGAPGAPVTFLTPPGTFTGSLQVRISTEFPAQIRYTTDGSIPTEGSPLYLGPIGISATTIVRARSFQSGRAPGEVGSEAYLRITPALAGESSDLPVVVLENFNAGSVPSQQQLQASYFSLFEPDPATGRTSLAGPPTVADRAGIKRRGSSTINNPKGNYRVEFWRDGDERDKDVSLLGMSKHDEWILFAPYNFDRALVRNSFLFGLSNAIGRYAPRTRFCEVYLNTDGGSLDTADYQGVYVLMERISRDGDRVDVERLDPWHAEEPEVSGGYILSIDRRDPSDQGFRSAMNHPADPANASPQPYYNHIYPKEQNITPEQSAYIRGYIDELEAALYGPDFTDPDLGYRAWLDTAAAVDHHLLVTFSKDPDGLRLSTYLHKPRGGKLAYGPLWDFDRAMGPDDDGRAADPEGWQSSVESAEYFEYDYWGRLFDDPDFMQAWIDRWQGLRRGEFADASLGGRVDALAAELAESQVRNQARWPGVAPNGGPLSGLGGYPGEVDHLKQWLVQRAAWIDSRFVPPPGVEPGGLATPGQVVALTPSEGTLYYTLDGSDPRLPGGAIHPAAVPYDGTDPSISGTTTVTARSYAGGEWSGPVASQFITGTPAGPASLVVSEIMYHPADPTPAEQAAGFSDDGEFEFLELQNVSAGTIELSGVVVSDCFDFEFTGSGLTLLESGATVLVVRNRAAFEFRHGGGLPIAGEWGDPDAPGGGSNLSNGGERVLVTAADGSVIRDFAYDDEGSWPLAPDGGGPSLALSSPFSLPDHGDGTNWRASDASGGDPGVAADYYPFWAATIFPPADLADPTVSAPEADPDGDGLCNRVELVLRSDPLTPSPERFPRAGLAAFDVSGTPDSYLTLTFTRDPSVPGLAATAQFGGALDDWPDDGVLVEFESHDDGTETVTFRDTVPALGSRRFARVIVSGPP